MQTEESDHHAVSTTTRDQEEPEVKRARDIDAEIRRLAGEIQAKGVEIGEIGMKIVAVGEGIVQDVRAFRSQGKSEEEIEKLLVDQKQQQTKLETQQAKLETQQTELKTQQAKLEAERSSSPPRQFPPIKKHLTVRHPTDPIKIARYPPTDLALTEDTAPAWVTTAVNEIVTTLRMASPALAQDESKPVPDDVRFLNVPRPASTEILSLMPEYDALDARKKAVMMATAVSGAGKTSAFCQVGRTAVVLYVTCARTIEREPLTLDASPSSEGLDRPVLSAAADLPDLVLRQTTMPSTRPEDEPYVYERNTAEGKRVSKAFIIAHLLLAVGFFRAFPAATPYQFMRFQFTALGQSVVANVFNKGPHATKNLSDPDVAGRAVNSLLASALEMLVSREFGGKLLVVVDEMEIFTINLPNHFRSRTGKHSESFLSAYLQGVRDLADVVGYSLIAAGTGSGLAREESVMSSIGKDGDLKSIRYESFPLASKENVVKLLRQVTGLSEKSIEETNAVDEYVVGARYRMVARTCRELDKLAPSRTERTAEELEKAVHLAEEKLRSDLVKKLSALLTDRSCEDKTRHERIELLRRVYFAARLSNGQIPFTSGWDLCQIGVAVVNLSNEFFVKERFVLKAIEQTFLEEPSLAAGAEFKHAVAALATVLIDRGATTASKGDLFENVITATFLKPHINGKHVLDLPFVDAEAAPEGWQGRRKWKGVKVTCSGTAVLAKTSFESATAFLLVHPNELLCPEKEHRADGILLLGDGCILELGMKLHARDVSIAEARSQFRSTDPACAYELADAWKTPNSSLRFNSHAASKREAWVQAGYHKRPALRVHITVPRPSLDIEHVSETKPGTYFLPDGSIIINLDVSNIHLLLGVPSSASSASSVTLSSVLSSVAGRLTRAAGREARARDNVPHVGGPEGETLRAIYRMLYEVTGAKELLRWCDSETVV